MRGLCGEDGEEAGIGCVGAGVGGSHPVPPRSAADLPDLSNLAAAARARGSRGTGRLLRARTRSCSWASLVFNGEFNRNAAVAPPRRDAIGRGGVLCAVLNCQRTRGGQRVRGQRGRGTGDRGRGTDGALAIGQLSDLAVLEGTEVGRQGRRAERAGARLVVAYSRQVASLLESEGVLAPVNRATGVGQRRGGSAKFWPGGGGRQGAGRYELALGW